ncbi:hypothetical protein HBNXNv_1016 [Candidatus Nanohalovita haloferacivicina]|nr:hypothetical protein HBNXNv_1016 [Candidatus Nanohalobia archaeon BNXNv]
MDFIGKKDVFYIFAGLFLLALAASGMQFSNSAPEVTFGEEHVVVNLTVEKPDAVLNENVSVRQNSTVFHVLNSTYDVEYTEYDFGYFVTSINGLSQNDTHSWLFYVDGEMPSTSVDNYRLSDSANVTFRYSAEQPY